MLMKEIQILLKKMLLLFVTTSFAIPLCAQEEEVIPIYTIGIEFRDRGGGKIYSTVDFDAKSSNESVCWVRRGDHHHATYGVGWIEVVVVGDGSATITITGRYDGCVGIGTVFITYPEPESGIKTTVRIRIDQSQSRSLFVFNKLNFVCPYDWTCIKSDVIQFAGS